MVSPQPEPGEIWSNSAIYESFMGRWSRIVAREFLCWLDAPPNSRWLDVGCGTGALSEMIAKTQQPVGVKGVDSSGAFIGFAREQVTDRRVRFETGDARALSLETAAYDAIVSGLALNFVPEPEKALREMVRVARLGGVIAVYVWDYAGKMQFLRHFWNAAAALDPAAIELDEGRRFPLCRPGPLADLFHTARLKEIEVVPIDAPTEFASFDDYWTPFLAGHAPAQDYALSLSDERRAALQERLRASLPFALDGSIPLTARAWAVKGVR